MLEAVRPSSPDIQQDFLQNVKSSRLLTQRQNYERFVYSQKQKNLQKESHAIKVCIEREEKDVIKQLLRLEEEKCLLSRRDELIDKELDVTNNGTKDGHSLDAWVNPYPVTLPGGLSLRRRRFSLDVLSRSNERLSAEYEDIDSLPSTKRLPPLSRSSGTNSPASLHCSLQRSSSWVTLHDKNCQDKPGQWQGDPEAIYSIRRPLRGSIRSPRSPGLPHDILRNAQVSRCLKSISRSQSLKEKRGPNVDVMMRSRSLKERLRKPVDDITDALSDCDISGSNGTFYRRGAIRARRMPLTKDAPLTLSNCESKESGTIVSNLHDVSSSTLLQRRHRNAKK